MNLSCVLMLTGCLALAPLSTASTLLWSIGTPDARYSEFRGEGSVVYRIGADVAGWPKEQSAANTAELHFMLPAGPTGAAELRIHILVRTAALPRLVVEINGKRGQFLLSPTKALPPYNDHNYIPYFGKQTLTARVPASFLLKGDNKIGFTVSGPGAIYYDAVELYHEPAGRLPACQPSARLIPTIFWRSENGALRERVDLLVHPGAGCGAGTVETALAGETFHHTIPPDYAFGDLLWSFDAPDPGAGTDARIRIVAGSCRKELSQRLVPARKWKLYIASTTHLDIGYTTRQPEALNLHLNNAREALDVLERHPEFRWNLEGAWLADRFLKERAPREAARLLGTAQRGELGVNALHSNLQASMLSLEEWSRATELGHDFGVAAGVPMDVASLADVGSMPLETPTVLKHAGIRYLVDGASQFRAPILHHALLDERSPMFWEGPDGSRVLCWFIRGYGHANFLFGIPGSEPQTLASLPHYLGSYPASYPYDAALIYGFGGDNAVLRAEGNAGFYADWNRRYEYPKLIPSCFRDFFTYVESQGTGKLEVIRGDGGAYWDDGSIEGPRSYALNRRNQAEAVETETLASLAVMRDSALRFPTEDLKRIWNNILLFDEHTFGRQAATLRPDWPETRAQWAIKSGFAQSAARDLDWSRRQWLSHLVGTGEKAVAVWNPSSWSRSGIVELEIPGRKLPAATSGGPPLQVETVLEDNGRRIVRFLARDIPPLHWRVFPLVEAPAVTPASTAVPTLENEFYRVVFDSRRVGIRSIVEKATGKELIDPRSDYAAGEYVRSVGAGNASSEMNRYGSWDSMMRTTLNANGTDLPAAVLELERAVPTGAARVWRSAAGSVGRMTGTAAAGTTVELEVRLWDSVARIDWIERLHKPRVAWNIPEAIYFAFPFNVDRPEFSHDRPLGWVNPATGMMPGSAPEIFGVNSAVNVATQGVSLTLASAGAPLFTFGDIFRGRWPAHYNPPARGTVFGYVYNNYWPTNFPPGQEDGDLEFQYSMTSAAGERAAQSRFGEEARHPLIAMPSAGASPSTEPPVVIESSHIHLVTLKPSPTGTGYLLRLVEEAGQPGEALVRLPGFKLRSAHLTSTFGEPQTELAVEGATVRVPLTGWGLATVRVE